MNWFHRVLEFLTILFLVTLGAGFVWMYFIQQDYYQEVRAHESHRYGQKVVKLLSDYHARRGHFPETLDAVQPPTPDQIHVGAVSYQSSTGILSIQLAGDSANEGTLLFDPQPDGNRPEYTCHARSVPDEYRPKECLPY